MLQIDIEVFGENLSADRWRRMGRRASNARPAWQRLKLEVLGAERELWSFPSWTGLAPSTRKRKTREGKDIRVLRVTGRLERALTVNRARGQHFRATRNRFEFGIKDQGIVFYGRFAHTGEGEPKRDLLLSRTRFAHMAGDAVRDHILGINR